MLLKSNQNKGFPNLFPFIHIYYLLDFERINYENVYTL